MQKTKLKVKGMNCMHCVDHVTKALTKVPGVASAKVDLKSEQAEVEYDPAKATLADMEKAVQKAGYNVVGTVS